jgi:hypothetical protein
MCGLFTFFAGRTGVPPGVLMPAGQPADLEKAISCEAPHTVDVITSWIHVANVQVSQKVEALDRILIDACLTSAPTIILSEDRAAYESFRMWQR